MRNPVNRLATAAPRAFDSILKQNTTTTTMVEKGSKNKKKAESSNNEKRGRGASFHVVDLSVLLNEETDASSNVVGSTLGGTSSSITCDETASVLTFDATTAEMIHPCWGWNDASEELNRIEL